MKLPILAGLFAFLVSFPLPSPGAPHADSEGVALTVYNDNLALVRDRRRMEVAQGTHTLLFEDIAATLDPTSVNVASLSDPKGFRVLEQDYEYDLVDQAKLLQKYVGQEITLLNFGAQGSQKGEDLKVKLLSAQGGQLVVQKNDGNLLNVYSAQNILFPRLPEGLLLKPTLSWLVKSEQGGPQSLNLAYLATGLSWNCDYTLSVNEDEDEAAVNGWVTVNNQSGTTFKDARLKLLAGDVHRVQAPRPMMEKAMRMAAAAPTEDGNAFAEKAFSDYHLYTLGRTTTLRNNETKQVELLSAGKVPVHKVYRYDGAQNLGWWGGEGYTDPSYGVETGNANVDVVLELKNDEASGLGVPLPAGKIRVYKRDDDGGQEFLGEDAVDHTPKDETVKVKMGTAFDVKGERKQTDFQNPHDRTITETFKITLKNHKKQAVKVNVTEHLYRFSNWKIETASAPFEKMDARTVLFPVSVPADGKVEVTYTVKYWWK